MAKLIPAAERLIRARKLIQQARDVPFLRRHGQTGFLLHCRSQGLPAAAKDMIKFISMTPTATAEMKAEVKKFTLKLNKPMKKY